MQSVHALAAIAVVTPRNGIPQIPGRGERPKVAPSGTFRRDAVSTLFGIAAWGAALQKRRAWRTQCLVRYDPEDNPLLSAWGTRRQGRKVFKGGAQPPKYDPFNDLQTLDREIRPDLLSKLDGEFDGSQDENLAHDVLQEATMLASRNADQMDVGEQKRLQQEIELIMGTENRPQLFPHYRRKFGWAEQQPSGDVGEPAAVDDARAPAKAKAQPRVAGEHFFARKGWESVWGVTDDVVDLAAALQLPRPSRAQSQNFQSVVEGRDVVIADQAGSGKTLAYLLPLLKRHVFGLNKPAQAGGVRLLVLTPTSDLAEQTVEVAKMVSDVGSCKFSVLSCTTTTSFGKQRRHLRKGADVLVATPGRLRHLLTDDPEETLDLSACGAIVFDEVDVLVRDEMELTPEDLRKDLPPGAQWVFVSATLGEEAQQRLRDFEAGLPAPSVLPLPSWLPPASGNAKPSSERRLRWYTGAGLHKVSPKCEHILVDCSPPDLYRISSESRYNRVMHEKLLALIWHLRYGVLKDRNESHIVVFCNIIENITLVEKALAIKDRKDRRSGQGFWKVLPLHGELQKHEYQKVRETFNGTKVMAEDFFKKKILVCTDRVSRGMDFSQQRVDWVVLLDWPRDATEYLRRVGRTARGGGRGGVLSLVAGAQELRMAKHVTAAAVRDHRLQNQAEDASTEDKHFCIERFDPTRDWRSPEAAIQQPLGKRAKEQQESEDSAEGTDEDSEWEEPEWHHPEMDEWVNDSWVELSAQMGEDVGVGLPGKRRRLGANVGTRLAERFRRERERRGRSGMGEGEDGEVHLRERHGQRHEDAERPLRRGQLEGRERQHESIGVGLLERRGQQGKGAGRTRWSEPRRLQGRGGRGESGGWRGERQGRGRQGGF